MELIRFQKEEPPRSDVKIGKEHDKMFVVGLAFFGVVYRFNIQRCSIKEKLKNVFQNLLVEYSIRVLCVCLIFVVYLQPTEKSKCSRPAYIFATCCVSKEVMQND